MQQPTKIPTSLQAPPSQKSAPAAKLTPPPQLGPAVNGSQRPAPALLGQGLGASWTRGSLLLPESCGEDVVGVGKGQPLLEGVSCCMGSRKVGHLWACPGSLAGTVIAGGRRQVMFTLLSQNCQKASINPLNMHLALSPKITTRAVDLLNRLHCLQFSFACSIFPGVTGALTFQTCFRPLPDAPLPLSHSCSAVQRSLSQDPLPQLVSLSTQFLFISPFPTGFVHIPPFRWAWAVPVCGRTW